MNQKVLKTLEYHKIIEKLTEYAASEPGKRLCRELEPSSDFEEIVQAQAETAVPSPGSARREVFPLPGSPTSAAP